MMAHDYKAPRRTNSSPIAMARMEKGMTQEQLAHAIGVEKQQVSAWEVGRYRVPLKVLRQIAGVLGVDWVTLVEQQPEKKKRSPITDARKAKGWTQVQFAKAVGISQALISNYETGAYPVPQEALSRMAEVLGVSLESLDSSPDGENSPK